MSQRNAMVQTMMVPFVAATRECALQMMSNAAYVLEELPKVSMPEAMRERTREICNTLIGTKHDLVSGLFDLTEADTAPVTDAEIGARVERLVQWALEDLRVLHRLVVDLDAESQHDQGTQLASILVMESAGNVMKAFDAMYGAAEGLLRALRGESLSGTSAT